MRTFGPVDSDSSAAGAANSAKWLRASGEMAERIRAFDWSTTPLGPIDQWPQSLRTLVALMLGSAQPAYLAWGPALTSLYNDGYIPILGSKHPRGLGRPYAELWSEIWDDFRPVVDATLAGEAQHFQDLPVALAGRAARPMSWFTFSWTPARDESGAIVGFYCAAIETTDRVLAEATLRDSEAALRDKEQRLEFALRSSRTGGWELDLATGEAKRTIEHDRIFGYEALLPRWTYDMFLEHVIEEDRAKVEQLFEVVTRNSSNWDGECRIRRADGELRWIWFAGEQRCAADGSVERMAGIVQDITDRKRVEEAQRESIEGLEAARVAADHANEAKSRFLAAASHDLRQPLCAISLYVEALAEKLGPSQGELVAGLRECVGNLSQLLNDLLDLSKLDAGVVVPAASDFAVAELFRHLEATFGPTARARGLKLLFRPSGLAARTDSVLYRRLIGNLVSNAISFTTRGGVLVACRAHGGRHWIEVWDTGIGIPEDKRVEIFEEYRQLDTPPNSARRGSGLGLAIVARTARLLGVELRLRSRPGKGSLFAVELPPGMLVDEQPAPAPADVPPRSIGLVDDNPALLAALESALRAVGHEVVAGTDGPSLLAALGDAAPDILISDYRLGSGQSGLDVIGAAREVFGAGLPALLVTGDTDPKVIQALAGTGIPVLHKPLEMAVLQRMIAELT